MNPDTLYLKRWQTPQDYLEDNPLEASELKSGSFLRVVRCRWGGLGDFQQTIAWVILYGKLGSKNIGEPQVKINWNSFDFFPIDNQENNTDSEDNVENDCENDKEVVNSASNNKPDGCVGDEPLASQTAAFVGKPFPLVIGGKRWTVFEAEIIVPANAKSFSFTVNGIERTIGEDERWGHLEVFFDETRNCWTPGGGFSEWVVEQAGNYGLEPRSEGPLMSIVIPAWHTPEQYLREVIACITNQLYTNWELVIVNASPDDEGMRKVFEGVEDERIHVVERPDNDGIVGNTNFGLQFVHGDYVCFLDHDDLVEPEALLFYVQAIDEAASKGKRVTMLYCDEDSLDENGNHLLPLFKPPANLDLLLNDNYVVHWLTVSRAVLDATERSNKDVEGAQDYDLSLKAFEYTAKNGGMIAHIPHIMYHWRICPNSTNTNPDAKPYAEFAGQKAIEAHFERRNIPVRVLCEPEIFTYRALPGDKDWPSLDIFVHGGTPSKTLYKSASEYVRLGAEARVIPLGKDTPGDRNRAISRSSADIVAFLPADIDALEGDGLPAICGQFLRKEVGAVSPRVMRADGSAEYQNMIVTPEGRLTCLGRFLPLEDAGYLSRNERPYTATTAYAPAVFLRRKTAQKAGGFDRAYRSCDYALAQLCLNMAKQDAMTTYCPYLIIRRRDFTSALGMYAAPNALADRTLFIRRNKDTFAKGDPSHNPNLDPRDPYFRLVGTSWYSVPLEGIRRHIPNSVIKAKRTLFRALPRPNMVKR